MSVIRIGRDTKSARCSRSDAGLFHQAGYTLPATANSVCPELLMHTRASIAATAPLMRCANGQGQLSWSLTTLALSQRPRDA